jgi:curved DNA-binding protein CbpA
LNLSEAREILGTDDPHKQFRNLSKIHHPDAGGDPLEFHKIQQAYDTLTKAEMTAEYDLISHLFLQELDIPNVLIQLGRLEAQAYDIIASLPKKQTTLEAAKPKALGFLIVVLESAIKNLEEERRTAQKSILEINKARELLKNLYTI